MSRAVIRAALAAYIAPPNIAGLNKVYTSQPKIIQGPEFFQPGLTGFASGAVASVFIEREVELRKALGGATSGKKRINYDIAILIQFRSTKPRSEDAMDDYDALIERLKVRIRTDRTLGSPSIFQAGEAELEVISDLPKLSNDETMIFSALRMDIAEFITS